MIAAGKTLHIEVGLEDLIHCWKQVAHEISSATSDLPSDMDTSVVPGFCAPSQSQELYACMEAAHLGLRLSKTFSTWSSCFTPSKWVPMASLQQRPQGKKGKV